MHRQNILGLDIGGTKIAGLILSANGETSATDLVATPNSYDDFLSRCFEVISDLEAHMGVTCLTGIGIAGCVDRKTGSVVSHNLPFLNGKNFRDDLENRLNRKIRLANDASCAALAEAIDGAGAGHDLVLGLIMGTGVGSAIVHKGKLVDGANGLIGEIGHLPFPFRDETTFIPTPCGCGQNDCIERVINGAALSKLYNSRTGQTFDAKAIGDMARNGENEALATLDIYYENVAKAFVTILHSFDPEVIVVSGGLIGLPDFFTEIPKRWGRYALVKNPVTKLLPATHGAVAGVRGAAFLNL